MAFCAQMADAIDDARTLTRLDHLSRSIWQGVAAGAVDDDAAQALAEQLHARRKALRGDLMPVGIPAGRASIFPPRRLQRPPVRSVAITRRRQLAASGPMPPALACKFTTGELAVLRIVGDEVRRHRRCDRSIDEIAARAGVCRRLAQNAIREAARLGLVTVEERRREGRRNETNLIRVVSAAWSAWLRIGCKELHPTDKGLENKGGFAAKGFRKGPVRISPQGESPPVTAVGSDGDAAICR